MPVYFLKTRDMDIVKIGYTGSPEIWRRVKTIQSHSPVRLGLLLYFTDGTKHTERALHKEFNKYRLHGEWFEYRGDLVKFVQSHRQFQREGLLKRLKADEEREHAQENS